MHCIPHVQNKYSLYCTAPQTHQETGFQQIVHALQHESIKPYENIRFVIQYYI